MAFDDIQKQALNKLLNKSALTTADVNAYGQDVVKVAETVAKNVATIKQSLKDAGLPQSDIDKFFKSIK